MRIILTGSKGFIGKNIHDRLKIYGEEVVEVNYEDCLDFRDTFDEWDTIDMVIHQGAISSTTCTDLNKLHKYNIDYSVWLFEQAIKHQIPVKYASSASVYGGAAGSHTGFNWTINPLNFYALSKLTVDYWVQDHMDEFISVQGFRYHNVYGPRMGFKHVIPHLVQRFRNNENPFKIYGHDQTRSFNFIDDAVEGTVKAMESGKNGEIYHIGDEIEISIEELTRFTGKLLKFEGLYEYAPTYPGSVARRCPDISKAKKDLNYIPKINWENGLRKTVEWYNDYLNNNPNLHESFYDTKKDEE